MPKKKSAGKISETSLAHAKERRDFLMGKWGQPHGLSRNERAEVMKLDKVLKAAHKAQQASIVKGPPAKKRAAANKPTMSKEYAAKLKRHKALENEWYKTKRLSHEKSDEMRRLALELGLPAVTVLDMPVDHMADLRIRRDFLRAEHNRIGGLNGVEYAELNRLNAKLEAPGNAQPAPVLSEADKKRIDEAIAKAKKDGIDYIPVMPLMANGQQPAPKPPRFTAQEKNEPPVLELLHVAQTFYLTERSKLPDGLVVAGVLDNMAQVAAGAAVVLWRGVLGGIAGPASTAAVYTPAVGHSTTQHGGQVAKAPSTQPKPEKKCYVCKVTLVTYEPAMLWCSACKLANLDPCHSDRVNLEKLAQHLRYELEVSDALRRDIADMKNSPAAQFERCMCGHMSTNGWACLACGNDE